jgi:isopenicillin-N N-acyltransferase like protein
MDKVKSSRRLKVIELKGSPLEIGRQYGEACPEISRVFEVFREATGLENKAALAAAEKYLPYIQGYSTDIMDELKGIAEGAKLDIRQIVFINAWSEVSMMGVAGCTSFAATGEATENHELIMGQNYDAGASLEELLVVLRITPAKGPRILAITQAGFTGLISINSAGIGIDGNFLAHRQYLGKAPGVPQMVWLRKAQSCENIGRAFGAIASAKRAGIAVNTLLGSQEGDIIDIESTPDDLGILYPKHDFITHSNHFYTERFKPFDMIGTIFPDSIMRSQRLLRLMRGNWGKLSVNVMQGFLRDHNNYAESICRHVDPAIKPELQIKTVASIISSPREQKMFIAWGNPCENEYNEYQL